MWECQGGKCSAEAGLSGAKTEKVTGKDEQGLDLELGDKEGKHMPPKKNAEGKTYPWAIEGKDFAAFESLHKYANFVSGYARIVGREEEVNGLDSEIGQIVDENESLAENEEYKNIMGAEASGLASVIKVASGHQGYYQYFTPEQKEQAQKDFENAAAVMTEVSESLRNAYAGREDARSRRLQERADQVADLSDLQTEVYNPKAGNIVEAEFRAPYLYTLNMEAAQAPKFDELGIEECVRVMDQEGVPNGKSIYDDYMTMMSSGSRETKVQFHRQQMEATGWDADKEQTYLRELRHSHQQTVEAFDRLWEVDDRGQYDSVLGNHLDHMIGKSPSNTRDSNAAVGYLKGELQAMDMGYDSRHLHVLGQIGMQEQYLKKHLTSLEKEMETYHSDPEMLQKLETRKAGLLEYQQDLNQLKASVWNKKVQSKDEMEAAGKQVDDFLAAHQEKHKDVQGPISGLKNSLNYVKEEAAKSEPIPQKALHAKETMNAINGAGTMIFGFTRDPQATLEFSTFSKGATSSEESFKPEKEQGAKLLAGKMEDRLREIENGIEKDREQYPNGVAFQKEILESQVQELKYAREGIAMGGENAIRDRSFSLLNSVSANLNPDYFSMPEKKAALNQAVKDFSLDKFAENASKLQKHYLDYELNKDNMQPGERKRALAALNAERREMVGLAKDMQKKMKNPTPELKDLFVKEIQFKDFQGARGLQGIINAYEREFTKVDIPQTKDMDRAMAKFNTERSSIFKKESDEHKELRETAERVRQNLDKLSRGTVETTDNSKERTMTAKEKEALLKETWADLKKLDDKADQYIAHATKNGTKTPNTPAGKDRLAGAKDIKSLTERLKKQLGDEPELKEMIAAEKAAEAKAKLRADREAKVGASGANQLEMMDKEVEKFKGMCNLEFHDSTPESIGLGMNAWEYQAARVVAIAGVTEAAMNGKIAGNDIKREVIGNTNQIAKDPAFKKWVKNASENSRMSELGKMSPSEIKADFVKSMSKDMEKQADGPKKEATKKVGPQKSGPKKEAPKKSEPKKEPPKKDGLVK